LNYHDCPFNLLLSVVMMSSVSQAQDAVPILEGLYIGQKPPGLTPEVFAPSIVSTVRRDWTGSFTPDMKEYYFNRNNKKSGKRRKLFLNPRIINGSSQKWNPGWVGLSRLMVRLCIPANDIECAPMMVGQT
jgi:hypothetical protein